MKNDSKSTKNNVYLSYNEKNLLARMGIFTFSSCLKGEHFCNV